MKRMMVVCAEVHGLQSTIRVDERQLINLKFTDASQDPNRTGYLKVVK